MKEFSKLIKNDGSEDFRKCIMHYCLTPKDMPIRISKEDVEAIVNDPSITIVFERGDSMAQMTEGIQSCKERFSRCVLKMVYLKFNPNSEPSLEDVWDKNGLVSLFANKENPLYGLTADETIETKMEMMFAYSPQVG